jgi:putative NIF3 family GTP cyclohydrolase 1 type 2
VLRCISSPGSEGVTIIIIKKSPFDNNFRQIVADHIRNAKKTIKIVTGEISSYNYYDLRNAAEDAAERGVKIDVYATSPDRDIINRLIHNGINVYTTVVV